MQLKIDTINSFQEWHNRISFKNDSYYLSLPDFARSYLANKDVKIATLWAQGESDAELALCIAISEGKEVMSLHSLQVESFDNKFLIVLKPKDSISELAEFGMQYHKGFVSSTSYGFCYAGKDKSEPLLFDQSDEACETMHSLKFKSWGEVLTEDAKALMFFIFLWEKWNCNGESAMETLQRFVKALDMENSNLKSMIEKIFQDEGLAKEIYNVATISTTESLPQRDAASPGRGPVGREVDKARSVEWFSFFWWGQFQSAAEAPQVDKARPVEWFRFFRWGQSQSAAEAPQVDKARPVEWFRFFW